MKRRNRTERLTLRLTKLERELLEIAALESMEDLSAFIRAAAVAKATRIAKNIKQVG